MTGFWGNMFRPMGSAPSSFSPKLYIACEKSARQYEVGAEVELSMIFADSVRSGKLDVEGLENHSLELKGVSEPVSVRVVKV